MEVVKGDFLPCLGQLRAGILVALEPSQRCVFFGIDGLLFAVAHVALVAGLRGHHAAVILKVKFALPGRNRYLARGRRGRRRVALGDGVVIPHLRFGCDLVFELREIALCGAELHGGHNHVGVCPVVAFVEHSARGSAAVVANAVEIHHVAQTRRVGARNREVAREPHGIQIVVGVIVREVGEHLAAIGRLPPEELEGELIGVVPRGFLRDKVIHAGALVDLRQLPGVAKRIGIPADADVDAVLLLEPALANENAAHLGFAVGHVQVGLDPHAAYDLPAAFLDALLDLVVHLRIFFRDPLVVGRGRLRVGVVRILVHQLQSGAEGALDHVDGFGPRPEPCGVDVRVAGEMQRDALDQRLERVERGLRLLERGIELCLIGGVQRGQIDRVDGLLQRGGVAGNAGGDAGHNQRRGEELQAHVFRIGAALGEIDLQLGAVECLLVHGVQQLDRDQHLVARFCVVKEDDGLKIVAESDAAAVEVDDFRHGAVGAGREVEPDARAGKVVSVQRFGNFNPAAEPLGLFGGFSAAFQHLPCGVVERGGFAVCEVAGVKAPLVGGQLVQLGEALQDGVGLRVQLLGDLSDLLGRLCGGA